MRAYRGLHTLLRLLLDCILLMAAFAAAIWFYTYLSTARGGFFPPYVKSLPFQAGGYAVFFFAFGLHRSMRRYTSVFELIRLIIVCLLATITGYIALRHTSGYWLSPILAVTAFCFVSVGTVSVRLFPLFSEELKSYRRLQRQGTDRRVPLLIVGAGDSAEVLIKDIRRNNSVCDYRITGLVDDDERKIGFSLQGVRVLGTINDIAEIARRTKSKEIIIAIPTATTVQRKRIMLLCAKTNCRIRMMGAVSDTEDAAVVSPHKVRIEDLLGRNEIQLDLGASAEYIIGKCVLVTGGGGSIGSELCRQIMRLKPKRLVVFDSSENNAYNIIQELSVNFRDNASVLIVRIGSVQDRERLWEVFDETSPEVVFHAAAYKHVPLMEEVPELAVKNNVFGTFNAAECSVAHKVTRFVMISTDKAVNPTNVMGASKRLAEMVIHSFNGKGTEFVAVRFGNVLGSNGSVVPIFQRQIEVGGPVTVTHPDVIRYFMTIPEAVRLVLQAGAMAKGGETFVLNMGEPVKIVDLARTMIELSGLEPEYDIPIIFTGLRPGEKLYEELLLAEESVEKTADDKIFVAREPVNTQLSGGEIVERLQEALRNKADMRRVLQEFVPTYNIG